MLTMNVLVALVAVLLVALATQLDSNAGSVGAGLVTLITLGTTLTSIVVAYTGLETSLGAISRLKSFGEETELEGGGKRDNIPCKAWPTQGGLQFRGVNASYDGTNQVLRGLDFVIKPREKVGLCGRTGRFVGPPPLSLAPSEYYSLTHFHFEAESHLFSPFSRGS